MRATAIVPVKRFGAAKQRLSGVLADRERARMAAAMLGDVLEALISVQQIERLLVISREPQVDAITAGAGAELIADPADESHSQAASIGVEAALAAGAERVVLLPGDCPLLEAAELDAALERTEALDVGVIPDRHGTGTNGLILRPPDGIVASFGPGSCERHLQIARQAGLSGDVVEIPSLGLDLDTAADLDDLRAALAKDARRAPRTAGALEALAASGELSRR